MSVTFNHTIVAAKDRQQSADFFTELFGLPAAREFGPFLAVELEHGVSLDYAQVSSGEDVRPQHYAFLVSEDEFDAIYGRIQQRNLQHWRIRTAGSRERSTTTTAAAASTSRTPPGTTSRSSPGRTGRVLRPSRREPDQVPHLCRASRCR